MTTPVHKINEPTLATLFIAFTQEQKYSVLNLLHLIVNIEGSEYKSDSMLLTMNFYVSVFKVRAQDAMAYFSSQGIPKLLSDLDCLSRVHKEILVLMCHDFITLGGSLTKNELMFLGNFFNEIGVSDEEYISVVTKREVIKEVISEEAKWTPKTQVPPEKMQQAIQATVANIQKSMENK